MSLMDEANTWPASRPGRRPIIWPEGRGTYGNTGHRKYNICLASVCVFSHTHTSGGRLVCVYYHTHTSGGRLKGHSGSLYTQAAFYKLYKLSSMKIPPHW